MLGIVYKDCIMSFAEHPLNLRNSLIYASYKIKTVRKTTETITYLGPKIWSIVQDEIKESASLETFRRKTHLWKTNNCPCRIFKKYIAMLASLIFMNSR